MTLPAHHRSGSLVTWIVALMLVAVVAGFGHALWQQGREQQLQALADGRAVVLGVGSMQLVAGAQRVTPPPASPAQAEAKEEAAIPAQAEPPETPSETPEATPPAEVPSETPATEPPEKPEASSEAVAELPQTGEAAKTPEPAATEAAPVASPETPAEAASAPPPDVPVEAKPAEAAPEVKAPEAKPAEASIPEAVIAETGAAAKKLENKLVPPAPGLAPAPAPELTEESEEGALPKIGKKGVKPWQYYAREAPARTDGPTIAVMVVGVGLNRTVSEAALHLPPAVTISLSPYAPQAAVWASAARAAGHEILLDLPLEPAGFPAVDPGPLALLAGNSAGENEARLKRVLTRASGYIGVYAPASERFLHDAERAKPALSFLAARGLLMVRGFGADEPVMPEEKSAVDSAEPRLVAAHAALPMLVANISLEAGTAPEAVDAQLLTLENEARRGGQALVVIEANPAALKRLSVWMESIEKKGFFIIPVSALARMRFS